MDEPTDLPASAPRDEEPDDRGAPETWCGYVTLLGAANVGKSTLLNALLGQPLSSVTAKAQTTWRRVTGIRTSQHHQLIFLDTPGILRPRDLLQRTLLEEARTAVREADVLVVVVDPVGWEDAAERGLLLEIAGESSAPRLGVVNKVDVAASDEAVARAVRWLEEDVGARAHRISALEGKGMDALVQELEGLLPRGPFLFPVDEIASDPVRFFVAEMVRETIFEQYREEVPYAAFCEVEEFRDGEDRTYIQVTVFVERASQKAILIGKGGAGIRQLGTAARAKIEHFVEGPVYLDLWVKVLPGWRRKRQHLRRLGFTVPDDDGNNA